MGATPSAIKRRLVTNTQQKVNSTIYLGDLTDLYYQMDNMSVDEYLDIIYNVKNKNNAEDKK